MSAKRTRSLRDYTVVYDKAIFQTQHKLCQEYGVRSKTKDLGRGLHLLKKYRSLARRQGVGTIPYKMAEQRLWRKGILRPNQSMNELCLQDFLERRLVYLVASLHGYPLPVARNLIAGGKVWYRGKRLRVPGALIPRCLEAQISIRDNKKENK